MIKKFSKDVIDKLGYYVYRLIDPRNGQTFYIGKGKGNRIFDHVNCIIKQDDYNKEYIGDNDPHKYKTIKQIQYNGLEVLHIIQRWNLTEKEAFEVESALIDYIPGLTNVQKGYHSEFGVSNAESLQTNLSLEEYVEPFNFKYVIIKVKEESVLIKASRYEATRGLWAINPRSIQEYPYVFSVTDGVVREVYRINSWNLVKDVDRYEFNGIIAEDYIRKKFLNKRLPKIYRKKGMAAPVLFSKNLTNV